MSKSFYILVAHERSGTHMLRGVLNSHPQICAYGEVCNASDPSLLSLPESYISFLRDYMLRDTNLAFRGVGWKGRVISDYVSERLSQTAEDIVAIDVKYSHLHNFEEFWWEPLRVPNLFRAGSELGFKFIHLHRKNTVETVISSELAKATGVWNLTQKRPDRPEKIAIDLEFLRKEAEILRDQQRLVDKWLADFDSLTLSYEDISPGEAGELREMSLVAEFLGIDPVWNAVPEYVKMAPPLSEIVEQYDEVLSMHEDASLRSDINSSIIRKRLPKITGEREASVQEA